ncbi:MAG TPA: radical SAM protein [Planctomycetota bacterium]|nr:radical SAM protein [Planctomycetota bacterium]
MSQRVLLVNPKTVNKYYHVTSGPMDRLFSRFFARKFDRSFDVPSHSHCTTMPPVTLFALEALFGGRCQTTVVDEQVDPVPFDGDFDLVCLTATTPQMPRAAWISERFRSRGVPTAIGGVHASCLPDECSRQFDVVCVGEAEGYVDEMVEDLAGGRLKPRYENHRTVSMADVPFYRYAIGSGKYLPFHVINFSRGCVFKCDFCSIQATLGDFRTRPVDGVVAEIEAVGSRNLWFPDATLTANPRRARELFAALVPLKVRWLSQITLNCARDESLLDLMAESGCWLVSIGFESLSEKNIRTSQKLQNRVDDYQSVIEGLHRRGIAIEGNFVFGFDEDREDVFSKTADFVIASGIDLPEFYVLTPYPDTQLYQRLLAEGRIVDRDWSHYDNTHFHHLPVYEPRHMSREELRDGCRWAERKVYARWNVLRRLLKARLAHPPVLMANYIYSSRIVKRHDLIPVGEEYEALEKALAKEAS